MDVIETREHFDQMSGIRVTLYIQENRYTAKVIIPAEIFEHVKKVRFTNKMYHLSLDISEEDVTEDIVIVLKQGYKKGKYGLIKNKQAILNIKGKTYSGKLVLNPKFYIRGEYRATSKNLKKAEGLRKATITLECERPSGPKKTVYTVNNISHPYQGGRVSPK